MIQLHCISKRYTLDPKIQIDWSRCMEKDMLCKCKQKRAGDAILLSDKIGSKQELLSEAKKIFIMIKVLVH